MNWSFSLSASVLALSSSCEALGETYICDESWATFGAHLQKLVEPTSHAFYRGPNLLKHLCRQAIPLLQYGHQHVLRVPLTRSQGARSTP